MIDFFEFTQPLIGQIENTCRIISWYEYPIIISLIVGSGVVFVTSGISVFALVSTVISFIIAGASTATIAAAVAGDVVVTGTSLESFAALIVTIKSYLGC